MTEKVLRFTDKELMLLFEINEERLRPSSDPEKMQRKSLIPLAPGLNRQQRRRVKSIYRKLSTSSQRAR